MLVLFPEIAIDLLESLYEDSYFDHVFILYIQNKLFKTHLLLEIL
jgi:hypothetical protein